MSSNTQLSVVYIVEADEALSLSMKCLLELHNFHVVTVTDEEDLLENRSINEKDIVLMELHEARPKRFHLLNKLMKTTHQPAIILMTALRSVLRPTDIFTGDRIKILTQPIMPQNLLDTISAIEFGSEHPV